MNIKQKTLFFLITIIIVALVLSFFAVENKPVVKIYLDEDSITTSQNMVSCKYTVRNNSFKTILLTGYLYNDNDINVKSSFEGCYNIQPFEKIEDNLTVVFDKSINQSEYLKILEDKKILFRYYDSLETNDFKETFARYYTK